MSFLSLALVLLAGTVGHSSPVFASGETRLIEVDPAISVNKASPYPTPELYRKLMDLSHRLWARKDSLLQLSFNAELLVSGRIYTAEDLIGMKEDEVAQLLGRSHCQIFDAYELYRPVEMKLRGELNFELSGEQPRNILTMMRTQEGKALIIQVLARTYFARIEGKADERLGMFQCFSVLRSSDPSEAQLRVNAELIEDPFEPLLKQLRANEGSSPSPKGRGR